MDEPKDSFHENCHVSVRVQNAQKGSLGKLLYDVALGKDPYDRVPEKVLYDLVLGKVLYDLILGKDPCDLVPEKVLYDLAQGKVHGDVVVPGKVLYDDVAYVASYDVRGDREIVDLPTNVRDDGVHVHVCEHVHVCRENDCASVSDLYVLYDAFCLSYVCLLCVNDPLNAHDLPSDCDGDHGAACFLNWNVNAVHSLPQQWQDQRFLIVHQYLVLILSWSASDYGLFWTCI